MSIIRANRWETIDGDLSGILYVDTVYDLVNLDTDVMVEGQQVSVSEYHKGKEVGGGLFHWEPSKPKTLHNGGYVIDPDAPFPSTWEDTSVTSWLDSSNEGSGCWIRVGHGVSDVTLFGALGDGETDCRASVQKSLDTLNEAVFPSSKEGYVISSTHPDFPTRGLIVSKSNAVLTGLGGVRIWAGTGMNSLVHFSESVVNVSMSNLRFEGNDTTYQNIYADCIITNEAETWVSNSSFENIYFHRVMDTHVKITGYSLVFNQCSAHRGDVGYDIDATGTSIHFNQCGAGRVRVGFHLKGVNYSSITNSYLDNGDIGFVFYNCRNISMSSCGTENVNSTVRMEKSASMVVDNLYVTSSVTEIEEYPYNSDAHIEVLESSEVNLQGFSIRYPIDVSLGLNRKMFKVVDSESVYINPGPIDLNKNLIEKRSLVYTVGKVADLVGDTKIYVDGVNGKDHEYRSGNFGPNMRTGRTKETAFKTIEKALSVIPSSTQFGVDLQIDNIDGMPFVIEGKKLKFIYVTAGSNATLSKVDVVSCSGDIFMTGFVITNDSEVSRSNTARFKNCVFKSELRVGDSTAQIRESTLSSLYFVLSSCRMFQSDVSGDTVLSGSQVYTQANDVTFSGTVLEYLGSTLHQV